MITITNYNVHIHISAHIHKDKHAHLTQPRKNIIMRLECTSHSSALACMHCISLQTANIKIVAQSASARTAYDIRAIHCSGIQANIKMKTKHSRARRKGRKARQKTNHQTTFSKCNNRKRRKYNRIEGRWQHLETRLAEGPGCKHNAELVLNTCKPNSESD